MCDPKLVELAKLSASGGSAAAAGPPPPPAVVQDTIAPVITLLGSGECKVSWGTHIGSHHWVATVRCGSICALAFWCQPYRVLAHVRMVKLPDAGSIRVAQELFWHMRVCVRAVYVPPTHLCLLMCPVQVLCSRLPVAARAC